MKIKDKRLKICNIGCNLLIIFLITTLFFLIFLPLGYLGKINGIPGIEKETFKWIVLTLTIILIELNIFLFGITAVYFTSSQLSFKIKLIAIIFILIPVINIIIIFNVITIAKKEVIFENKKHYLNEKRKNEQVCKTKYPLLLVHGVFFRDTKYLNYWGRIPKYLEKNGATIFYGEHNSAASVDDSAIELEKKVQDIIEKTGCEKVNIIAHSKGGLDARTLISRGNVTKNIASLTTINTPHRGCIFADYLLNKLSKKEQIKIASKYNKIAEKIGDSEPDFLGAVNDLTSSNCKKRQDKMKKVEGIFYQSVGSKLNNLFSGQFPLNFTYNLVKYFDGENDGLVGIDSFEYGERYIFLTTKCKYGISHGDVIDLNRKNLEGFDVREFYMDLVSDLKKRGL